MIDAQYSIGNLGVTLSSQFSTGGVLVIHVNGSTNQYLPASNTDSARATALTTAWATLVDGDTISIAPGDYKVESTLTMLERLTVYMYGCKIYHSGNTVITFTASNVHHWSIKGYGLLEGSNDTSGSPSEIALNILNCNFYTVDNLMISNFAFQGLYIYGSAIGGLTVNYGKYNNINFYNNVTGLYADSRAEYNLFNNFNFNTNTNGIVDIGGNNRYNNTHLTYNTTGIQLLAGTNDSHGSFIGGACNHSTGSAFVAKNISNGYNIVGMDFFATDGTSNYIDIDGCGGLNFNGGTLASPIRLLNSTQSIAAISAIKNMYVHGAAPSISDPGNKIAFLKVQGCYTDTTYWSGNTVAE